MANQVSRWRELLVGFLTGVKVANIMFLAGNEIRIIYVHRGRSLHYLGRVVRR